MLIAKEAFDLVVAEEVSSEATYRKKYRRPVWPGGQSGVTIGVGYDLGQVTRAQLRDDWAGHLPDAMIAALERRALGVKGDAAHARAVELRSIVDVPWEAAIAVHADKVLPRFIAQLRRALPNTDRLNPECLGSLASLSFNRGFSYGNPGPRYAEMRAIKAAMASCSFADIPRALRAMKRLWPDAKGLRDRRDHEAALFERGLRSVRPAGLLSAPDESDAGADDAAFVPRDRADPAEGSDHASFDGPASSAADNVSDAAAPRDVDMQEVQKRLRVLGYYGVGNADGDFAALTRGAIVAFKHDNGLAPETPDVDQAFLARLSIAKPRPISDARANATASDIAPKNTTVWALAKDKLIKLISGAAAGVTALVTYVGDKFRDTWESLGTFRDALSSVPLWIWLGLAAGILLAGYEFSRRAEKDTVDKFRRGELQ